MPWCPHVHNVPLRKIPHVANAPPREIPHVPNAPPRKIPHVANAPPWEIPHVAYVPPWEIPHIPNHPIRNNQRHISMTPSFQEAPISQIPALRFLQQFGFSYLSPEEVAVERKGKFGKILLEGVLAQQLRRLNKINFKGRDLAFSDENIAKAIESLRDLPFEGLVRTSEKVYDLLTLGKSMDQTIDGETKGFTLRYIDWENPWNNVFQITAEFEVERSGSHETRRPDIVCFVNGIPFIIIECKRPEDKDSLEQAIHQNVRNWQEDGLDDFFYDMQIQKGIQISFDQMDAIIEAVIRIAIHRTDDI